MERYLAKLYRKSEADRNRFALVASGLVTFVIFGAWSLTVFGTNPDKVADNYNPKTASAKSAEVSPFESIRMNMASSFEALRGSFGDLKSSVNNINIETEYKNMRDNTLNTYGE